MKMSGKSTPGREKSLCKGIMVEGWGACCVQNQTEGLCGWHVPILEKSTLHGGVGMEMDYTETFLAL